MIQSLMVQLCLGVTKLVSYFYSKIGGVGDLSNELQNVRTTEENRIKIMINPQGQGFGVLVGPACGPEHSGPGSHEA